MELTDAYRAELRGLYAFLVRLGAPRSDLEDLVHDVFVVAMKRWPAFDQRRPIKPWLWGIAWRVFTDASLRMRPVLVDELPDLEADGDGSMERRDAHRQVQKALGCLDGVKRAAFVMHHLRELSVVEISEAMDVPVQTTYSRLRAARLEFAEALRRNSEVAHE